MATSSDDDKDRPDADDAIGDEDKQDIQAEGGEAASAPTGGGAAPGTKAAKRSRAAKGAKAGSKRAPAKADARPRAPAQGGALGKSMILFIIIIGGLAGAFAFLGRESGGGGSGPKWKVGDKAEVEITLVQSDMKDLACWSSEEVKERHCAFEAPTKGWSKGDADDKKLLKPYTTTDRVQFLGAGLWSEPALTGKLPSTRFAVKCSYSVEGKVKRPGIRWSADGAWLDQTEDWYAGSLTNCKLVNP